MIAELTKWGSALIASVLIHGLATGWFFNKSSDDTKIEGGAPVQISMLGDAFQNEIVAGQPDELVAQVDVEVEQSSTELVKENDSKIDRSEPVEQKVVHTTKSKNSIAAQSIPVRPQKAGSENIKPLSTLSSATPARNIKVEPVTQVSKIKSARTEVIKPDIHTGVQSEIIELSEHKDILSSHEVEPEILNANTHVSRKSNIENSKVDDESIETPIQTVEVKPDTVVASVRTPDKIEKALESKQVIAPEIFDKIEPVINHEKPTQPDANEISPVKTEKQKAKRPDKKANRKINKKPKRKKTISGSRGKSKQNARAGNLKGSLQQKNALTGKKSNRKFSNAGNSKVSNYKGKIRQKVKRRFRPPRGSAKSKKDAVVRFVVSSSGGLKL